MWRLASRLRARGARSSSQQPLWRGLARSSAVMAAVTALWCLLLRQLALLWQPERQCRRYPRLQQPGLQL
jgi:hypothetical protein